MRTYPSATKWPADLREAHVFLIRAIHHLRHSEAKRYANIDAESILNKAQVAIASELYPGYFKEVA